ncbi:hypothetical protein PVK06_019295 [Gossypium arboreum]|uniref:BED-type domain-containing protein n=1 Tax=Gossypium arboreum TaxID=29729 RepID=A0ABR0PJZ5_GOSAR|nr:hypothetical protein PVK06_019295 [Gossypium arboreum]
MPRSRSKEGEAHSDDYGWRWGEPVDGGHNNVKCKLYEKAIKGGITRLKEHLTAKKWNVAPCPNVLAEQRRKEELKERIRLGDHGDYGDSDVDDEELTIARCESIRSKIEWEERQRRRARIGQDSVYETGGGSSSETQVFSRSFSIHNSERSGKEH